ncbi:MAG: hypothetical protein GY845_35270 [Planctomycetes bacterium]|nr:hypothetical protein [Planctomycetota bacterium]
MIDLITKLIDRFIQLAKQRNEQNRSLFSDFVQPMLETFKEVHKDYLKSFDEYRHIIEEADSLKQAIEKMSPQIDRDALFSSINREDLWSMRRLHDNNALSDLLKSIFNYLDYAFLDMYEVELEQTNRIRYGFRGKIQSIASDDVRRDNWREEAIKILNKSVSSLQKDYSRVSDIAHRVKESLLLG